MNVVNQLVPQTAGPHLVLAGAALAWRHGEAIDVWNLTTGKRTSSVPADGTVALGVSGGAPVAVLKNAAGTRLRELSTGTEIAAEYASSFTDAERVHAAGDTLFVAQRGGLTIYKIKAKVEVAKSLPWKRDELKSFTGVRDAVYFHDGTGFVRVDRDGTSTTYASSASSPVLVAAGPRPDTLWTTTADELQLVTLAAGKAEIARRVKLANIYHLAAAGEAAAVVTVAMDAGAYRTVSVSVVAADGDVRWTKSVPPPTSTIGWIAGSATHVAVAFGDALHAWSAKDGSRVELRE